MGQRRGWEGAVLKLMRARDFVLTVTDVEDVTPLYRRLRVDDGGLLAATGVHPTMWVRLWFANAGRPHQRAYTLVAPDPEAGTFALEFALHEGCASDWARAAKPGDTIEATVQGTDFEEPVPAPSHVYAIVDPASLPALNSCSARWVPCPRSSGSRETRRSCRATPIRPCTNCGPSHAETRAGISSNACGRSCPSFCATTPTPMCGSPSTPRPHGPWRPSSAKS